MIWILLTHDYAGPSAWSVVGAPDGYEVHISSKYCIDISIFYVFIKSTKSPAQETIESIVPNHGQGVKMGLKLKPLQCTHKVSNKSYSSTVAAKRRLISSSI